MVCGTDSYRALQLYVAATIREVMENGVCNTNFFELTKTSLILTAGNTHTTTN